MKWLFSLVCLTIAFVSTSFFIPEKMVFAFRWMTIGMAIISFVFYFITRINNHKSIGGNILAITFKFLMSPFVFITYYVATHSKNSLDYYFFIIAYILYSIVCYTGAYYNTKNQKNIL
jgi:hypothetical protein